MSDIPTQNEIADSLKKRRSDAGRRATDFVITFVKQPDHVAVILATARMDDILADLIRYRLIPCPTSKDDFLDGAHGLSSFSLRIDLAYRLGIIDSKLASVLHIFRRIRNKYAHSYSEQTLDQSPHRDRLAELETRGRSHPKFESMRSHLDNLGKVSDPMKTFAICSVLVLANLESAEIINKPVDAPFAHLISYP